MTIHDPHHPNGGEPTSDGQQAAFAAVYDRLAGRLLGAARTLGCSGAEAEDIVHDLFVRMVHSGAFLGDVDDPDAYAFTSLRHAVFRRRQRRALERSAIERIGRQRDAEGRSMTAPVEPGEEPDAGLAKALAALPEAQREVVALKVDGGLTFAQIAKVTNVSLNTAAGRYRYAMEKLRAALAEEVTR